MSLLIEGFGELLKFIDFVLIDKVDEEGVYFEVLLFVMNNLWVLNIVLIGFYGLGKSSII